MDICATTPTGTATFPVEIQILEQRDRAPDVFWALHTNRHWAAVRSGDRGTTGQWQQFRSVTQAWHRYDDQHRAGFVRVAWFRTVVDRLPGDADASAQLTARIVLEQATAGPPEALLVVPGFAELTVARPWLAPLTTLPYAAVADNGTLAVVVADRFADTAYLTGLPARGTARLPVDPAAPPPRAQLDVFAALVTDRTAAVGDLLAAAGALC